MTTELTPVSELTKLQGDIREVENKYKDTLIPADLETATAERKELNAIIKKVGDKKKIILEPLKDVIKQVNDLETKLLENVNLLRTPRHLLIGELTIKETREKNAMKYEERKVQVDGAGVTVSDWTYMTDAQFKQALNVAISVQEANNEDQVLQDRLKEIGFDKETQIIIDEKVYTFTQNLW